MAGYPPGRIDAGPPRPPLPDVDPTPVDPAPPGPAPAPAPPAPPPAPAPAAVVLVDVPAVSTRYAGTTFYADILNRDPDPFTSADRPTNGHESCHGVNARLRDQAAQQFGGKANGFYVLGGKGVLVPEPKFRKSQVNAHVPAPLRGSRFQLYLAGQSAWDDQPTYLLDEWVAYIAGACVAVEDYRHGKVSAADWLAGPVEFSFYALAVAKACAELDAAAWREGTLRACVGHNLQRADAVYASGLDIKEFAFGQQGELLRAFRGDPACAALRDFAASSFPSSPWLTEAPVPAAAPGPRALGRQALCRCLSP